jgi:cytochrome P450
LRISNSLQEEATVPADYPDLMSETARLFDRAPDLVADPYPVYKRMRDEAPVFKLGPLVVVTRYADIRAVLKNTETFSSQRASGSRVHAAKARLDEEDARRLQDLANFEAGQLQDTDEPVHSRIRGTVDSSFTPRKIRALSEVIQGMIDDLLQEADSRGSLDLVRELASPLPLKVICHMLRAGHQDSRSIKEWSDAWSTFFSSDHANVREAYDAIEGFRALVGGYIAERRGEQEPEDLLGSLIKSGEGGQGLTDEELVQMVVLLLFAGHETTTNLIGNGVVALHEFPQQLRILGEDPSLIHHAVDEFLRYNSSVHTIHRVAARDCELGGVAVAAGDTIRLILAAANHDDAVFENSEELDVRRPNASRHVGMGYGIHTCLGVSLAKLEAELVFTTLITRYPEFRVIGEVRKRPAFGLMGPVEVAIQLRP